MRYIAIILILISFSCTKQSEKVSLCNSQEVFSLRGKPIKPEAGLVLLDFDGYSYYAGCNASEADKQEVLSILSAQYIDWQVTFTLSETEYNTSSIKKQRVLFTNSGIGFLGIAILGSMTNQEDYPALVWWYATRYYNNPNRLASFVATHELGHTLNLKHTVDTCGQSYALPVNGVVPVMGNPEYATSVFWANQKNDECIIQNDRKIIGLTLKKR